MQTVQFKTLTGAQSNSPNSPAPFPGKAREEEFGLLFGTLAKEVLNPLDKSTDPLPDEPPTDTSNSQPDDRIPLGGSDSPAESGVAGESLQIKATPHEREGANIITGMRINMSDVHGDTGSINTGMWENREPRTDIIGLNAKGSQSLLASETEQQGLAAGRSEMGVRDARGKGKLSDGHTVELCGDTMMPWGSRVPSTTKGGNVVTPSLGAMESAAPTSSSGQPGQQFARLSAQRELAQNSRDAPHFQAIRDGADNMATVRILPVSHHSPSTPPTSTAYGAPNVFDAPAQKAALTEGMDDSALETDPESLGKTLLMAPDLGAISGSVHSFEAMSARSGQARLVAAQMAEAIAVTQNKSVEIALSPEELGRVRMVLSASDTGVVLSITAERPETLELMRRHIDQLAEEFRQLGYDNIKFEFANDGEKGTSGQGQSHPSTNDSPVLDTLQEASDTFSANTSRASTVRGLDMRL